MEAPAIILVAPQMGENIGAAARIMGNFDLRDLRLVAPRDGWPNEKALAMATGAADIVRNTRVFDDLATAVADCHHLYATTARPRDMIKTVATPRDAAEKMVAADTGQIGILFGAEKSGLDNDAVAMAERIISIPVGAHTSLNIAQAVGIVAYEYFIAAAPNDRPAQTRSALPAAKAEIDAFLDRLEAALDEREFFHPEEKRAAMARNLRNLFVRAELTEPDVRILYGIIKALTRPPKR